MNTKNTQGDSWERDKQEWLDTFDQEYGDSLMSECIGIVARALYHKQVAPPGADASYITAKLHEIASKERAEGERREESYWHLALVHLNQKERDSVLATLAEIKATLPTDNTESIQTHSTEKYIYRHCEGGFGGADDNESHWKCSGIGSEGDCGCPCHSTSSDNTENVPTHTCCDGECNHDNCCGKVPNNCPLSV